LQLEPQLLLTGTTDKHDGKILPEGFSFEGEFEEAEKVDYSNETFFFCAYRVLLNKEISLLDPELKNNLRKGFVNKGKKSHLEEGRKAQTRKGR